MLITLLFCSLSLSAQGGPQFKDVPLTGIEGTPAYADGNKYQKDALLFVDMLAATHPYYIRAERRFVLESRLPDLLEACADCGSDAEFAALLREAMKEVRDRHTDVIDEASYTAQKSGAKGAKAESAAAADDARSPLTRGGELFSYRIFAPESICYLQFNQCNDARSLRDESLPRFDKLLEKMFAEMAQEEIETLIVDLQYNNGGSSRLCDELLDRLRPLSELRNLDSYLRFSPMLALYNPKVGEAMAAWEAAGHKDELYPIRQRAVRTEPHDCYEGKVVFIQGPKTYSSAGILVTLARDNAIGEVIGTESDYSPSHYGEVIPFRLPNTGLLGSVCTKYFERPDKARAEDKSLSPDTFVNLDDKQVAWDTILKMYAKKI